MNNSIEYSNRIVSRIAMFLLAAYPITSYYITIDGFTNGQLLFIALVIFAMVYGYSSRCFVYPKGYSLFWAYVSIALILTSGIKGSYLIPGGINFFLFSLFLGFCSYFYNDEYFRKFMRIIFIVSSIIFLWQEIMYFVTGNRPVVVLPLGSKLTYENLSLAELASIQKYRPRSSAFFLEASFFAIYALLVLAMELFCKNRNKLFSKFSYYIIAIIILSRSGCGIIGLSVLLLFRFITYFKQVSTSKRISLVVIGIPLIVFAVSQYLGTEYGEVMMSRSTELTGDVSDASGYLRVVRGFTIFENLPLQNKLLGISTEELYKYSAIFVLNTNTNANYIFLNGFQSLLIQNGLIGLTLFLIVYIRVYRNGDITCRAFLVLLLVLSLIDQNFLMSSMLIALVMSYNKFNRTIKI